MDNIATKEERIIDESYEAVFVLNKSQIESHLCAEENKRKAMTTMRVRLSEDGNYVVTESTDGKCLIQVSEKINEGSIEHYPLDVNPSETTKAILKEPQLIPATVLDEIAKGFPRRKNFCAQPWQRTAVISMTEDGIEVGRSNKQGRPQVDTYDKSGFTVFPPVEQVWPTGDAKVHAVFDIKVLKRVIEAMERAGADLCDIKMFGEKTALQFESVNKYGHTTDRPIKALLMPTSIA